MKHLFYIVISFVVLIGCTKNSENVGNSQSKIGQGGSMARFTILGNYLYTVDDYDLNVFSITETNNPVFINKVGVGFRIETLFSFEDKLFIGSQNGMFIYSIENPEIPAYESDVSHFTSCDPVVTDGEYAYVTLHSGTTCGNELNVLQTYEVSDVRNPVLLEQRNMISPKGLGLYHDYLLVCDDEIKIFDTSMLPASMSFVTSIETEAFDVIIQNNHLMTIGEDRLSQYSLNPDDITDINLISTIEF